MSDATGLSAAINLHDYDRVYWNTSAGKDSMAVGIALTDLARRQDYPLDRITAIHCDLRRVEWTGTAELAEEHARALGVRFLRRAKDADLLQQVRQRRRNLDATAATLRAEAAELAAAGWVAFAGLAGDLAARKTATPAWPSSQARYCTSDQKTSQVEKQMTADAKAWRDAGHRRPIRILNCLGIRAAESRDRADKIPLARDPATNSRRLVTRWLPIFEWTDEQVWDTILRSGLRVHGAYLSGMSRLSCALCILASRDDLVTAARLNPGLVQEYAAVEDEVGSTFLHGTSVRDIAAEASARDAADGPIELPAPAALTTILPLLRPGSRASCASVRAKQLSLF